MSMGKHDLRCTDSPLEMLGHDQPGDSQGHGVAARSLRALHVPIRPATHAYSQTHPVSAPRTTTRSATMNSRNRVDSQAVGTALCLAIAAVRK